MTTKVDGALGVDRIQDSSVLQADLASGVVGKGPAFSASQGALFSANDNTNYTVKFSIEDFDTASCYDLSTGRFTPNVAGYYLVGGGVVLPDWALTNGFLQAALYKNGAFVREQLGGPVNLYVGVSFQHMVYLNGTTDYITLEAKQSTGATHNLQGLYFQGYLVRAA